MANIVFGLSQSLDGYVDQTHHQAEHWPCPSAPPNSTSEALRCTNSGATVGSFDGGHSRILNKAAKCVSDARIALGVGLNNDAGRGAYLAALHAAMARTFSSGRSAVGGLGDAKVYGASYSRRRVTPGSAWR